jgi:membrane-associated protease RseP (regulator of RpoE activity)
MFNKSAVVTAVLAALVGAPALAQPGPIAAGDQPTAPQGKPRLGVKLAPGDEPGALIVDIMPGFAAETAGLQPGDRVVRIGDDEIADLDAFRAAISKMADGDVRTFTVVRDAAERPIEVKLTPPRSDAPGINPPTHPQLRDELLAMREEDQAGRRRMMEEPNLTPEERNEVGEQIREADEQNRARLKEIIAQHGFPTVSMVGDEAAGAAFLIVQHADAEPQFQEQMLPVLEELAKKGEASKSSVAYLTDRVRRAQDKPQVYATQYVGVPQPDGTVKYDRPIVEDPENLDTRRRAMGLEPWANYERRMAEMQGREPFERVRGPGE